MKNNYELKKWGNMRRRAEDALQEKFLDAPENLESLPLEKVRHLLHELRVHQIELEMQNEDLRRTQLELEVSRAQYFDLYELAPIGYLTLDELGLIKKTNLTASQLLGMERDKLTGEPLTRFITREEQDNYYFHCKQLLNTGGKKDCEIKMTKKDGSLFWAQLEMSVLSEDAEKTYMWRVIIVDITERKQAEQMLKETHLQLEQKVKERTLELEKANEELRIQIGERNKVAQALRDSEEHFRKIVDTLPIAIFGHAEEGIIFANTAAADLIELTASHDLLEKNLADFLNEEAQETFSQQLKGVLFEGEDKKSLTAKLISSTGTAVDVELFLTPFIYQKKPAVHITSYNISRRKKIEEEIIKADKLEAISILAGGIAHDFNNYLATLLGNISLAKSNTGNPHKINKYLDNMEKATLHIKDLTLQLFTFAKGGAPVKKTVHIGNLIDDTSKFLLSGTNVRYQLSLAEEFHPVEVDEGQISQVLYNIIINAVHAMPEGGNIKIKGENVTIKAGDKADNLPLAEGKYVKISITDEGPGIPQKHLRKIFDPFFSTKLEGNGLGLAASYSIIKNHDGYIQVESEMAKGATFSIFLPASP